ncbi:MAG TPA: hypothetical protein VM103_02200 [Candidatus Paceibacterota bacterium]|nr:hypothetical protein [Candidatus Paceibacterota bacterium]
MSRRGFTLVEVVILIGLIGLILTVLSSLFLIFNRTAKVQDALVSTAGSAGSIVNGIQAVVHPADQVLVSHAFATGTYASGTSTLVAQIPSIDSSGNVVASKEDYAVIYQTGTSVYRRIEADAASSRQTGTKLLGINSSSLTFTYDQVDFSQVASVTVDIGTQAAVKQQTFTSHLRERIYLRNR